MLKLFTRSSQIGFHNIRMCRQVIFTYMQNYFLVSLILAAMLLYLTYDEYNFYGWFASIKSLIYIKLKRPDELINAVVLNNNVKSVYQYTAYAIYNNAGYFNHKYRLFTNNIIWSFEWAFLVSLIGFTSFILALRKYGKGLTTDILIRGRTLASVKVVNKLLKKQRRQSDFKIGDLHIVKGTETRHMLLHGTTGVGKTVLTKSLIRMFREKNQRGLIFDEGGAYVEEFYDESRGDVILSPHDARCVAWAIYDECDTQTDFENLAAALIPSESDKDPFWVTSARNLVSSIAYTLKRDGKTTYKSLLQSCLNIKLSALQTMLKDTPAEMLVDGDISKTAITIRAVITNHIKALRYLPEIEANKRKFSLRDWVLNESENNGACVFVLVRDKELEATKSLISLWIGLYTTHVKSMPRITTVNKYADRRLWLVLDEVTKLNNLFCLTDTLTTGRNYGLCCVLGLQNKPLFRTIYGRDRTSAIIDLLSTQVFFRSPTNDVSSEVSKELGFCDVQESTENQSYGADKVRDGININHNNRNDKPIVTSTQVEDMDDLDCFIKLPADLPLVRLKLKPTATKYKNEPFILRKVKVDSNIDKKINEIKTISNTVIDHSDVVAKAINSSFVVNNSEDDTLDVDRNVKTNNDEYKFDIPYNKESDQLDQNQDQFTQEENNRLSDRTHNDKGDDAFFQ